MRPNHFSRRALALLLAALMLCTSCGGKTEASTMRLMRTEGTVSVTDAAKKDVAPKENLMLYSGYAMATQPVSYAWIDLDEVKLTKMDENSDIEIQKDGKKLEIFVNKGSLFFNITRPLAEDETLEICTSNMVVGIRGTCGWVVDEGDSGSRLFLLEGQVEAGAAGSGSAISVSAGESAHVYVNEEGKTEVAIAPFPVTAVPEFVRVELVENEQLAADILEASGLDVLNPPEPNEAAHAAYDQVLAAYRDFHAQGLDFSVWDQFEFEINGAEVPELPDLSGHPYFNNNLQNFGWPSHYAYYDIDGNGVDELVTAGVTDQYRSCGLIYAFNGTDPVLLQVLYSTYQYEGRELQEYEGLVALMDGTFAGYVGNGGLINAVHRLSADGFTLEDVPDSPLAGTYDSPTDELVNYLDLIPLY